MLTQSDNEKIMNLAIACANSDGTFQKVNNFFKSLDPESNSTKFSKDAVILLSSQAKQNRLNIFFQNVLCMM